MIKKFVSFSFLALFLNACATPHVVSVIGPNDSKMNCSQLDGEIAIASNYKRDAKCDFRNFPRAALVVHSRL